MKNNIFKSEEGFSIIDYSNTHQHLLLRSTVVNHSEETFYNIDIDFIGVAFLQIKPQFMGIEINISLDELTKDTLNGDMIFLLKNYSYYKNFEIVTENKTYHIIATDIKISQNTLDVNTTSLTKY